MDEVIYSTSLLVTEIQVVSDVFLLLRTMLQ